MPRGYPDYSNPNYQVAGTQVDLGALILAATGFQTVDGLGRLIWYENFRNGLNGWARGTVGNGVSAALDTANVEIPPVSCKLNAGTAAGLGVSVMQRPYIGLEASKVGIEFSFDGNEHNAWVEMFASFSAPTVGWSAALRIITDTGEVQIYTGAAYVTVVTLGALTIGRKFIPVKLVFDLEDGVYTRIVIGSERTKLTGYALTAGGVSTPSGLSFYIQARGEDATAAIVSIGRVALTTDEP